MGFTRSTTDISVHQSLSDYPNQDDNLSAAQLKEKFDMPAETLQDDLNGLMTELEAVTSAENIGADVIAVGDESDANVQAKLEKIYEDMQNISQGAVADGSITAAKLASSLSSTIGFKDGTLQTGLNAEKVGGNTLAQIQAFVTGGVVQGSYTGNTTNSSTTQSINLGFKPKLLLISGNYHYNDTYKDYKYQDALVIFLCDCGKGMVLKGDGTGGSVKIGDSNVTATSTGFTLTGFRINYSSETYYYVAIR